MKTIKYSIVAMAAALVGFISCTDYQDEIDSLDKRVTILENLVQRVNDDIVALQTIVDATEKGDVITRVDTLKNGDGDVTGYRFIFLKNQPITIYNGKDGDKGNDAAAPVFTTAQAADGSYYWLINGVPVTDDNGNRLTAVGKDGQDGQDGKTITPRVRILDGIWQVSYDDGKTWDNISDPNNPDTPLSAHGADGKNADNVFEEVIAVYGGSQGDTPTAWTFKLTGGQSFTIDIFVAVTSVRIRYNGNIVSSVTVDRGIPFQLTAEALPASALYKDVVWYVVDGNTADISIIDADKATTVFSARTSGSVVTVRAAAKFSQPGQGLVYADCAIICR